MKIKIFFLVISISFFFLCIFMMFFKYPSSADTVSYFKSGYFRELDTQFNVIADAFIELKMMSRPYKKTNKAENKDMYVQPVYSWIMLDDIAEKHKIAIKIYDKNANHVPIPYNHIENDDEQVIKVINSKSKKPYSRIDEKLYKYYLPVKTEKRCLICHTEAKNSNIIGVMTFERTYDSLIYYAFEKKIIFTILAFMALLLTFLLIIWDPERNIKELFDKTE